MPTVEWMENEVRKVLPNSIVKVTDLTGGKDHFHLRVVDAEFENKRPLARQKIILTHFKQYIPYQVHALDIQALTPKQAGDVSENVFHPHGGGQGVHSKSIERRKQKNGD
jgi:acid stress-induced BolA-like protein IbaG/YrbA